MPSLRTIIYRLIALLYLGAMALCITLVIKPGASLFYPRKTIDSNSIKPDTGYAHRYPVLANPGFFRIHGLLLFEDERQLTPSASKDVIEIGKGGYSLSDPSSGNIYLYFSSSDNSDPGANGRSYSFYLPFRFLTRSLGVLYLLILFSGLIGFLYFAIAAPARRRIFLQSTTGGLRILDQFFDSIGQRFKAADVPTWQEVKAESVYWRRSFTLTVLASFFYVLMEWIFFVTKPSFMSIMSFIDKAEILLLSGLFFSIASLLLYVIYLVFSLIGISYKRQKILRYLGAFIPTILLSAQALLLIDNFTYTVFQFGIVTSHGIWRAVYACLFILMVAIIYGQILRYFGLLQRNPGRKEISKLPFYFATGILCVSIALALITFDFSKLTSGNATPETQIASSYPNVILLGGDGLSAENLSVYGYEQDTTPRLRELALTSLLADNAFTNANSTTGSITSILTGKLPTQNGVIYAPNILSGENAYQHLPGMLKKEGYLALEYGVRHFVDAYSVNMLLGFDIVNGSTQESRKYYTELQSLGYNDEAYFLSKLDERITERLQHIFFIRDIQNPYFLVTQPVPSISDQEKLTQMLEVIEQSDEPVFVHAHLMGTHKDFKIPVSGSSNSGQQDELFRVDLYNGAIRSFDYYVGQVIDRLKVNGEYENTILVIYSDHPVTYMVNQRIPLIIHFPAGQYAGRVSQNVQNLDIAPTILDYLGSPVPKWMSGNSLLEPGLDEHRLIFSMAPVEATEEKSGLSLDPLQVKPPFYQFRSVTVLDCQRYYYLDLVKLKWGRGDMLNYVNPCKAGDLLSFDEIQRQVKSRLIQDGFDVSSLP